MQRTALLAMMMALLLGPVLPESNWIVMQCIFQIKSHPNDPNPQQTFKIIRIIVKLM